MWFNWNTDPKKQNNKAVGPLMQCGKPGLASFYKKYVTANSSPETDITLLLILKKDELFIQFISV